jgi:hypothetical protein
LLPHHPDETGISKTSLNFNHTMWHYNPEDSHLSFACTEQHSLITQSAGGHAQKAQGIPPTT